MKRILLCSTSLLLGILSGCSNSTSSQKFEGILTYKIICDDPKSPEMNKLYRSFYVYIKNGKELDVAQIGNATVKVLCNSSTGNERTFIELGDKKVEFKKTEESEKAFTHETKLLDDTKDIIGYSCKYARLTGIDIDGKKYSEEVYYTDLLPAPLNKEWRGLNGYPLQSNETNEDGSIVMTTIQSVSKQDLPDSIFNAPNGYQLITREELNNTASNSSSSSKANGSIIGSAGYPGEGLPSDLIIYAENIHSKEIFKTEDIDRTHPVDTLSNYILSVPEGEYYVFATAESELSGYKSYYDEFVTCGMDAKCLSHKKLIVNVSQGDTVKHIDPNDWYIK